MSDHEAVAALAKQKVLELTQRILRGETPSTDEMREAIAQMRGNRTAQAAATASGATRGRKAGGVQKKDLNQLLTNLGF